MSSSVFHQRQTAIGRKWLANLLSQKELSLFYFAFHEIIESKSTVNSDVEKYCVAILAAEVLSQLVGHPKIPPVIESYKIEQFASFLSYDQCKLRMIRLAIESIEHIRSMGGNLGVPYQQVDIIRDSDQWLDATEDLLYRLRMAKNCLSD